MTEQNTKAKKKLNRKIGVALFWLLMWQIAAWCVGNRILLAGPWDTAVAWIASVREKEFLLTCLYSVGRIGLGIFLGVAAGAFLGGLGYRFRPVQEILSPLMTFFKSVPVASFTVLLLIWWGSKGLSVAVVFIVVLPLVYVNVVQGLQAANEELLEMARVFRMPLWNRLFYIYRPALRPYVESGLGIALGMSWKSGVAAEVIGTPDYSIGEQMYMSKIYMDTAGLFAWTATVILLSFVFEKAGLGLWKVFCIWKPGFRGGKHAEKSRTSITITGLSKTFAGKQVLSNVSKNLESGKVYCLMAPSGGGKTTLLRILAGLESADEKTEREALHADTSNVRGKATVLQGARCTISFQENRLAEHLDSVENVMLVLGSERQEEIREHLGYLLPWDSLEKPCSTLSGGMKRRVSLVRALMAAGDMLLLDEPFAGLDEENKKKSIAYILKYQQDRTVIVATHDEEDAAMLGAEIWRL